MFFVKVHHNRCTKKKHRGVFHRSANAGIDNGRKRSRSRATSKVVRVSERRAFRKLLNARKFQCYDRRNLRAFQRNEIHREFLFRERSAYEFSHIHIMCGLLYFGVVLPEVETFLIS